MSNAAAATSQRAREEDRHAVAHAAPGLDLIPRLAVNRAVQPLVHRLPREIIQKIFFELLPTNTAQDPPHTLKLRRRGARPSWLAVAHVCREWRAASIEWKAFWTYIPLESPGWAARALALARDQPIIVDSGISAPPGTTDPAALELALACAPRARQISVASRDRACITDTLDALRAGPAPVLERLEIMLLAPTAEPPVLPLDMFQSATPAKLRVLVLMDVFLPPSTALLGSSLTHLELAFGRPAWTSLATFFDTAAQLPNLEYLALMRGSVLPPWTTGDPHAAGAPRTIKLPHCRTLRLSGHACVVLRTLQTLRVPNNEVGCMVFGYEPGAPDGTAHSHWSGLPAIPAAIQQAYCVDDAAPSTSMRHLVITSGMQAIWSSLGEMTAFLRTVPQLTTFIARCSPWFALPSPDLGGGDGAHEEEPVVMPALERLHLWSRFPRVLATLSRHIEVPCTAERLVTVDGGPPVDMQPAEFAAAARAALGLFNAPGEGPSYTELTVSELADRVFLGVCVSASAPTPPREGEAALPPRVELNIPVFTLGVPAQAPPRETVERLADLTAAVLRDVVPLARCRRLTVTSLLFEEDDVWTSALGHLKEVESLHAGPGVKMASTAAYMLWQTRLPPRTEPLFPALATLRVTGVDFRDRLAPFLQSTRCPLSTSRPAYALQIERSYVDAEILHQLSRPFDRLSWDGIKVEDAGRDARRWRREGVHTFAITPAEAAPVAA